MYKNPREPTLNMRKQQKKIAPTGILSWVTLLEWHSFGIFVKDGLILRFYLLYSFFVSTGENDILLKQSVSLWSKRTEEETESLMGSTSWLIMINYCHFRHATLKRHLDWQQQVPHERHQENSNIADKKCKPLNWFIAFIRDWKSTNKRDHGPRTCFILTSSCVWGTVLLPSSRYPLL